MSWSKMSVFIPQSHKYSKQKTNLGSNKTARFDLLWWNWCNSTLHQKVTLCVCVGTNLLSFGRRIWKNKRYQNTIWCTALFYLLAKTKATKASRLNNSFFRDNGGKHTLNTYICYDEDTRRQTRLETPQISSRTFFIWHIWRWPDLYCESKILGVMPAMQFSSPLKLK